VTTAGAFHFPSPRDQPFGEAVGAEVAAHDQPRHAVRSESLQPRVEKFVKLALTNADRRIRPNHIEEHVGWNLVGKNCRDVVETVPACVVFRERHGALVHVDGPDAKVR